MGLQLSCVAWFMSRHFLQYTQLTEWMLVDINYSGFMKYDKYEAFSLPFSYTQARARPRICMDQLNLNGTLLRIVTRYDNSYTYDVEVRNVTYGNGSVLPVLQGGYAINILFELSQMLNFSYILIPTVSHLEFGKAVEERIDLFAYSASLRIDRAKLVDFSFVIEQSRIIAFMNHAFETSGNNILLDSFSYRLWSAVLALIIVLCLVTLCFAIGEKENIFDAPYQCLALILQKDTLFQFSQNRSKSVLWISSISFIIITATYSGNIISIKSVVRYKINSLASLVDSDYSMLLEYGNDNNDSTILQIAKTGEESGLEIMTNVLKKCAKSKFKFESFEKAIRDVNSHPLAYVIDEETGFSAIVSQIGYLPCSWDKISFAGIQYPWTFYMRKNAPYKSIINSGLLILDERGVRQRIGKKWLTAGFDGCTDDNKDFIPISNSELDFGYIVLGVGFFCSILAALMEIYFHSVKTCVSKVLH